MKSLKRTKWLVLLRGFYGSFFCVLGANRFTKTAACAIIYINILYTIIREWKYIPLMKGQL